jgi:hypothetical protein
MVAVVIGSAVAVPQRSRISSRSDADRGESRSPIGRRFADGLRIAMADLDSFPQTSLHPGVDAQSWSGFEQRMQARRFDALLASARAAASARNAVLAQHALDEAREIRPHAPELRELRDAIRLIDAPPARSVRRRAAGAMGLLAVGVSMFVLLDSQRLLRETLPTIAPPPPRLLIAAPTTRAHDEFGATSPALALPGVRPSTAPPGVAEDERDVPPDGPAAAPAPVIKRAATSGDSSYSGSVLTSTSRAAREATDNAARSTTSLSSAADRGSTAVDTRVFLPAGGAAAAPEPAVRDEIKPKEQQFELSPPPPSIARRGASLAGAPSLVAAVHVEHEADKSQVEDVLRRYARAYGELDVAAARDVWPRVDQRALARAFDSLESQSLSFDDCQIDVQGATANASCHGQASYVGKVGRGVQRTEPRTWRFELRRVGANWKIEAAEARERRSDTH